VRTPAARRLFCVIVLLVLMAGARPAARASGEYRTVEVESLRITFDSEWASRTAPGYVPVRFDITNLGDARVIDITAEGTRFFRMMGRSGSPGTLRFRQAVRLARGDRVRLTVPIPVSADSENLRFEIEEDGRTIERFNYLGFQSGTPAADAAALIVADPSSPFGSMAKAWPRATTASGAPVRFVTPGGRSTPQDFLLEPARLPTNWLGYTSLRAVIIGPAEWNQLAEAQKSALLTWTACGGDLIVPDGDINALLGGRVSPSSANVATRGYLFGRIHARPSAEITASGLAPVLSDTFKLQDGNWALPPNRAGDWGVMGARGFRLLIPDVNGVPARAYLSILVLFALIIGPANYWFLWRRRQQVLLVLTAPLISAIFILLLAGYVVAGEGLAVSGRAVTFTMLDQARKEGVMRGSASLYAAGMTPAGGLHFARDVAVLPLGTDGGGSRDTVVLDLTETQRFSSGVVHARAPTNFEEIAFRPARERLTFTAEGAGFAVVNGLDAPITRLLYRRGGRVFSFSGALPSGARVVLQPGAVEPAAFVPSDIALSGRFGHLIQNQPEGSYIAILERSPFWDPGVPHVIERNSFHVLLGWPEGQP
jgi:hypothetical protein